MKTLVRDQHLKCVHPSAAGFTMIELLVAMMLLSIVLVGLAALQITTIRNVSVNQRANEATRLAQSIIEQHQYLPETSFSSMGSYGVWATLLKKDRSTAMINVGVDGEREGPFTVDWMVEQMATSPGQYIITVRVTWFDVVPGPGETTAYRNRDVIMSTRRFF